MMLQLSLMLLGGWGNAAIKFFIMHQSWGFTNVIFVRIWVLRVGEAIVGWCLSLLFLGSIFNGDICNGGQCSSKNGKACLMILLLPWLGVVHCSSISRHTRFITDLYVLHTAFNYWNPECSGFWKSIKLAAILIDQVVSSMTF